MTVKHMTAQETYELYVKEYTKDRTSDDAQLLHKMIRLTKMFHYLTGEILAEAESKRNAAIRLWNETHDDLKIIEPF